MYLKLFCILFISFIIVSPFFTASDPPGQKSFWTSTIIKASLSFLSMVETVASEGDL